MTRPSVLPVQLENIPVEMQELPRWVMWRSVQRSKPDGSKVWAKMPMTVHGAAASSTNAATWTTFDDAADTLITGGYDGIGLVLGEGLHGIDLDDCRALDGTLTDLAQEVLDRVGGYAEISPSGTGLKMFTRTNLDGSRTKKEVGVELYRDGRYFTVTGHVTDRAHAKVGTEVQDLSWFIEKVWNESLSAGGGGGDLANYKAPLEDWDLDRVVDEVLPHLDPDGGYEEWLRVGAAMHHQGEGDLEWLDAWDNWSAASGKWVEGYCANKWASFSEQRAVGRGALTLASLLKQTRDARLGAVRSERAVVVTAFMAAVLAETDPNRLEEIIARDIAQASLSEVEREQLCSAIQLRSRELGVRLPIGTVRRWVRRANVVVASGFVEFDDDGHPLPTLANLRALLSQLEYVIRYNVIKKAIEVLIPDSSSSRDNRDNVAIARITSECESARMSPRHAKQFMISLADESLYNPVATWIESVPWDGVSRLDAFYATVRCADAASDGMKKKLMRKWLIQAVGAAFSYDGIANQGVLTFVGPQNVGKTTWFQRLAPVELDAVLTGHTLDMRSKDSIFIALSYWIVELGELDATFSKSEISALKSFITQNMDKMRRPYAATESSFGRRTVFGATVNDDQYLNDPTGNRRYWSISVSGFDLDHGIDMQQVWAEVLVLYQEGERWSLDQDEAKELNAHNEDFTVMDPIEERVAGGFNWHVDTDLVEWLTATEVLVRLGTREPNKFQTIAAGKALKKLNGGKRKKSNGKVLFAVPSSESDFLG